MSSDVVRGAHHVILSTAPQLSISQKALGTLSEDGNVMPKHVGATIHRVRAGIAGYHFVFESFWHVRMISSNIFLPKYNLWFFI